MKTCEILLSEIKARLAKATPGIVCFSDANHPFIRHPDGSSRWHKADGILIAHSRTDLETLVAMVECAREALGKNCLCEYRCGIPMEVIEECTNCKALAELDRLAAKETK